ncbi:MAG: ATP-binding protein [Clostridia bacterium]|nr:ATP-binding protein [Clostridia bacterium]
MTNRESIYAEALAQKREAAERNRLEAEKRKAAVYAENPRLSDIDSALAELGSHIAVTAISGNKTGLEILRRQIEELSAEKDMILSAVPLGPVYDCPLCLDSGYVGGKHCECVKTLVRQIARRRLSQEMPLDECRFDNFDLNYYANREIDGINPRKKMTAVLKFCREYALTFDPAKSKSLLFVGGVGLGKTHLTLSIVSELADKGYDIVYGSAYNLLSTVEREHFSSEKGDSYESMINCDLLVIDDLGTEFVSPFTQSVLYNLINSRMLTRKPTIINTNLSFGEIEKKYTPRVASRLMGDYDAHKFFGSDIRQIKCMER